MKQIIIDASTNTPVVKFDSDTGIITVEGRSIPEDPLEFYDQFLNWTMQKLVKPYPEFKLEFKLDYINSASAKQVLNYLRIVREKYYDGCSCKISWYYEGDDEAILELGEHLKSTLGIPFELKEY